MATYKEIKGVTVQTRDEDPVVNAGSWASANSMNTARLGGVGAGQSPAAIMAGGYVGPQVALRQLKHGTERRGQKSMI